ncbi:LPXTG cell wall anchor domain-containing protein [Jiangella asiatica]|uniref:DUF11 domain-containing protein n=1 Tax=Jiangella asiatica TaxID=2530372 RepID=A0A4R5DCG3_9ACTN|nr:LPXTG cell wall anchor domain-containing protein [Jiangella asiatica]TDE11426.1 DUF11 domain-containing protein [Jiangella asiatica]
MTTRHRGRYRGRRRWGRDGAALVPTDLVRRVVAALRRPSAGMLVLGILSSLLLAALPINAQAASAPAPDETGAAPSAYDDESASSLPETPEGDGAVTAEPEEETGAPAQDLSGSVEEPATASDEWSEPQSTGVSAESDEPEPVRQAVRGEDDAVDLQPAEETTDGETIVSPTSVNPVGTAVRQDNTFYAYVGAGENIDIDFAKVGNATNAGDVEITVRGPGGVVQTCTALEADPAGSGCSWTDLTSSTEGVWQVDFEPVAATGDRYEWDIQVQSGAATIDGRVYSERYAMTQVSTATPSDFTFWYQSEHGFLYEATYTDFNGIDSVFSSDATGVAQLDSCVSAYESMDSVGNDADTGRLWVPPLGECGDPYKIFFENPDPALPATAQLWDGSTVWLQPAVELPDLSNLSFTPDSATVQSGEFTFDVVNFTGQLNVQVDVNNDGDYTDPEDVTVPVAVTQDGTVTVPFDGLDGLGNPIPATQELGARVAIDQVGEIHFVNNDVETRGGLEVQALNGPDAGSSTLYWNDTELLDSGRDCTTPQTDGTGGVDSTGGVHGWDCSDVPQLGNDNTGESGSWGDVRQIDDWTYHTIDEFEEIRIASRELDVDKTSDATADSRPGDTVRYTVTLTNVGTGDYTAEAPAVLLDDLTGVLDDATLDESSLSADRQGSLAFADPMVSWTGELVAGDSVTVTYEVTLTGDGDGLVRNVVFVPPCDPADPGCDVPPTPECDPPNEDGLDPETGLPCDEIEFELPWLIIDKVADTAELPEVGGTVTYTVVATNVGPGDYTATAPAPVVDDVSDVLDDATLDESTLTADRPGALDFTEPEITWGGELASGESVTITYTVTYTGEGDQVLINTACIPEEEAAPDTDPCATVELPWPDIEDSKSVEASDDPVGAGTVLTYTLTFTNTGSAAGQVDKVDNLTHVLDDADVTSPPVASDPALSVSAIENGQFTITGTLQPDQTVTVTYQVTLRPDGERGDNVAANFLIPPGEEVCDPADPDCEVPPCEPAEGEEPDCTVTPIGEIEDTKSADPESTTPVNAGQELTYTLTFTNIGEAAGLVDRVDDLTHVFDDADFVSAPTASDPALTATGPDEEDRIHITGELAAGQTVTVSYTVRVRDAAERGDDILANFLLDPQEEPPTEPVCEPAEDEDPDCTTHPVGNLVVEKSADPESGTELQPGDKVTYTLTFANPGEGPAEVDYTDHAAGVADDTALLEGPTASDAALAVSDIEDGAYTITGTLAAGQTVTVTYTVRVEPYDEQGDGLLENFLTPTGEEPPSECVETNLLCTEHPVQEPSGDDPDLPDTGANLTTWLLLSGFAMVIGGLAVAATLRRRERLQ